MPTSKRTAKSKPLSRKHGLTASRPRVPPIYGVPKTTQGILDWSHVSERMSKAMHYWICTVSADARPHATPVDGLWLDDCLYFGGSPQTRRNRHLGANPAVCVHLESGSDVVILQGDAQELLSPAPDLAMRLVEASAQKYGYAPKPEDVGTGGTYIFRPHVVFAWTQFPTDATRWTFEKED